MTKQDTITRIRRALLAAAEEAGVTSAALSEVGEHADHFRIAPDIGLVEVNTGDTVKRWLAKQGPSNPRWFAAPAGGATGMPPYVKRVGDSLLIGRADARIVAKYQAAKAAAEKAGVPLEIDAP